MTKINSEQNMQGNRAYKDSLFRLVFEKKEDLLSLYNAINGTNYQDVDELEVNVLENALYMGVKNDISFLIGFTLNLYEHQSTRNANMPLRGLIYITRQFEKYVAQKKLNIYSSRLQKLPAPQYIVFYNGAENEPDEKIMRLSDAFMQEGGCVECEARLLNINYGHNRELMEKCQRLKEYAIFVEMVRVYSKEENVQLESAITRTIDECIEKGILADVLLEQRNEVLSVILSTFDKELYEKDLQEEAYDEGYDAGYGSGYDRGYGQGVDEGSNQKLRELIEKKLAKGKSIEQIAEELEETVEVIREINRHNR